MRGCCIAALIGLSALSGLASAANATPVEEDGILRARLSPPRGIWKSLLWARQLMAALALLLTSLLVGGCGGSGSSSSEASTTTTASSSQANSYANSSEAGHGEANTTTSDQAEITRSVPTIDLTGPEGTSTTAEQICGLLSAAEATKLLPGSEKFHGMPTHIKAVPLPVLHGSGATQTGCRYEDRFEVIWLSDSFVQTKQSVTDLVKLDERVWVPIEIDELKGFYTPGKPGWGYSAELVVQMGDEQVFDMVPYKTSGLPGGVQFNTPQAGEAPSWLQPIAEKLASTIL